MEKLKTLIVGLLIIFGLSSCNLNYDSSSISDDTDGGPHSLVVGMYFFYSFDEYKYFYDIFKDYNTERYWVPIDNGDFDMYYKFRCVAHLDDLEANRYDIEFIIQDMYVYISDDNFSLELSVYDLNYINGFGAEYLSYLVGEPSKISPEKYPISFINEDIVISDGYFTYDTFEESIVSEKLDTILSLFKGGYDYVF